MATDAADDETPLAGVDREIKELLGLFDAPAFARRGQDLDYALARIDRRLRRERGAMLEMVRLRLRQWAAVADGPGTALGVFRSPIDPLWTMAEAPPPAWAERPAPARRLCTVARDLAASIGRFNRRWARLLEESDFTQVNASIDRYNRYYLLEKECSLGSARLASRHFSPRPALSAAGLLATYPLLPMPEPRP